MSILTPEAWHLTPEHVRHLCGSPAKVKLAPLELPREKRPSLVRSVGIFPGVTIDAPPLTAPLEVFVETEKAKEDRQRIYAAIRKAGQASRAEIVTATGLYLQRVIDLTREDEERGILLRLFPGTGRPVVLAMVAWTLPPKAEARQ